MAIEKVLRFIITCWDGDVYILEGYQSVEQIREAIGGLEWVIMPNGAEIKASAISKIQPFEDYAFQKDLGWRHKRGQRLSIDAGGRAAYRDPTGEIMEAKAIGAIMGGIKNALPAPSSTPESLTGGQ